MCVAVGDVETFSSKALCPHGGSRKYFIYVAVFAQQHSWGESSPLLHPVLMAKRRGMAVGSSTSSLCRAIGVLLRCRD